MRKTHLGSYRPLVFFAAAVLLGIVGSTVIQKYAVFGDVPNQRAIPLANTQDKLLTQRNELSKWLLGLAYTTLVGLLGLQIKQESRHRPAESSLSMVAAGLLVTSVFAAFLFQEATAQALESDIKLMYGSYVDASLQIQFYTLLAALVLLASWLFRPARQLSLAVLGLTLVLPGHAQSDGSAAACVQQWAADRKVTLSAESRHRLESLVGRIRTRAGAEIQPADECTYAASLSDQIRWIARSRANAESDQPLAQALSDLERQSAAPNALPGDWISQLIEASKLWRPVPYAQLSVRSSPEGLQVRISGDKVGMTNWVKRLSPGDYRLELVENDQVVYSERLHLADHSEKTVTYSK